MISPCHADRKRRIGKSIVRLRIVHFEFTQNLPRLHRIVRQGLVASRPVAGAETSNVAPLTSTSTRRSPS